MPPPESAPRAVIVGCATGIGAAGARILAGRRWRLALVDIAEDPLAALATELDPVAVIRADAADPGRLGTAIDDATAALGGLDRAWCNVGYQSAGSVEEATVKDLDRCYAVNVRAHFVVAQRTVPALRAAGGGALLLTASNAGLQTDDRFLTYSATKAATVAMVRLLARDHARDGIRVNALCPGWVDTPFNAPVWETYGGRESFLEAVARLVPIGRMATAEEVARFACMLLEDDARYVTGQALVIDGGETVA